VSIVTAQPRRRLIELVEGVCVRRVRIEREWCFRGEGVRVRFFSIFLSTPSSLFSDTSLLWLSLAVSASTRRCVLRGRGLLQWSGRARLQVGKGEEG